MSPDVRQVNRGPVLFLVVRLASPSVRASLPYIKSAPHRMKRTIGLAEQLPLFADKSPAPEGLRYYAAEFISASDRTGI